VTLSGLAILRVVARIAVIGLGEAGSAIARDLAAAGAAVVGFDPAVRDGGVERAASAAEAAGGADVVVSVNAASVAADVARSVSAALSRDAVFADLNTASPGAKRAVAAIVEAGGARFADVALMAPVAGRGLRTPALASGPGAARFAEVVGGLGMPVTAIGPETGAAAARKLVRSVFMKGLAAAIGESLAAADRIGGRDAVYADIAATLTDADEALLRRLVEGSVRHAARRAEEMAAACAMLDELGVEPRVAAASEAWLRSLRPAGG
jgi:3-hydroxyisobutyrate dehydrogenase-like beta-hydroxyacid dehydrogenase